MALSLLMMIGCAGPEPKLPPEAAAVSSTRTLPDTPSLPVQGQASATQPLAPTTLPAGYTLTDTTEWGSMLEEGQRAVLRRGGTIVDTVDLTFGVAAVGEDSLVFLPALTDTTPQQTESGVWYESFPTEHVLWTPVSRRELRHLLPFFDSYFSSPAMPRESVIHYWGIQPGDTVRRVYAMRYNFRSARLDSLFLNREDRFATDYRYHLGIPQIRADEVSFDGVVLDRKTWRIIRHDPPSN